MCVTDYLILSFGAVEAFLKDNKLILFYYFFFNRFVIIYIGVIIAFFVVFLVVIFMKLIFSVDRRFNSFYSRLKKLRDDFKKNDHH